MEDYQPILIDPEKWIVAKGTAITIRKGCIFSTDMYGCIVLELCDGRFRVKDICALVKSIIGEVAEIAGIKIKSDIIEKNVKKFLLKAKREGLIIWKK
jgi:hypothetical protein